MGKRLRRMEEGSGTMAGVMLVMVVGVALTMIACVGNLILCHVRARSVVDLIAVDAAYALWQGRGDPCALANRLAATNHARLSACTIEEEDVLVTVTVRTQVPIAPSAQQSARAGPVECPVPGATAARAPPDGRTSV